MSSVEYEQGILKLDRAIVREGAMFTLRAGVRRPRWVLP
jgi:hypothetical protein